jgi:FMN phosphatase YigB (HAD superfamily)
MLLHLKSKLSDKALFDKGYELAKFWIPDLQRDEILHVGDSLAADFCGARAAGFQALHLDRSGNPRVTVRIQYV